MNINLLPRRVFRVFYVVTGPLAARKALITEYPTQGRKLFSMYVFGRTLAEARRSAEQDIRPGDPRPVGGLRNIAAFEEKL